MDKISTLSTHFCVLDACALWLMLINNTYTIRMAIHWLHCVKTIRFRNDENFLDPNHINIAGARRNKWVVRTFSSCSWATDCSDPKRLHLKFFSENSLAVFTSRTWRSVLAVVDDARKRQRLTFLWDLYGNWVVGSRR